MKSAISKSVLGATVICVTILCVAIGTSTAFAQSPAAAPAPAPTAAPAPPAAKTATPKLSPDEKKKISQACSTQANDKKLHGKDRQKFRATCIRHGAASA